MKKKTERRENHNVGTHEQKMKKRRTVQSSRQVSQPHIPSSKYDPREEDEKHLVKYIKGEM